MVLENHLNKNIYIYNTYQGEDYFNYEGEQLDFVSYLTNNNISYDLNFGVSKKYVEEKGTIDGSMIHYEGNSHVKDMFVVGKGSNNYDSVNQLSNWLSSIVHKVVPSLSRGTSLKQSHYNQGITENIILLEVGAVENTKEEVQNTIDVQTHVLHQYLSL